MHAKKSQETSAAMVTCNLRTHMHTHSEVSRHRGYCDVRVVYVFVQNIQGVFGTVVAHYLNNSAVGLAIGLARSARALFLVAP